MKQKFLDYAMKVIKNNNQFDEIKLAELKYGLEAFYMLATKMLVFCLIALVFNVFKEFLIFLLFYTPLRGFGFGFHANNSLECWLISLPIFLFIPLIIKFFTIPLWIAQVIITLSIIIFLIFSPADTKNKPLINYKKRMINKTIVVITGVLYLLSTIFVTNNHIILAMTFACLWQAMCVNPLLYKLFKQPFNNYKNYLNEV